MMNNKSFFIALALITLVITIPYGLAGLLGGPDRVFTGFLLNPADGASYLAKMQQGYAGNWQFTLPFTTEPGEGTYLFLYYLFLGKMARFTGLSLQVVFHLARVLGAWLLLGSLNRFYKLTFKDRPDLHKSAFWLSVIGSGMGWLVIWLGVPTTDFWVAEAYPFLAMFANPHFPLGLALVIDALVQLLNEDTAPRKIFLALEGLLISIILPFGLVIAVMVAGVTLLWEWWIRRPARPIAFWMSLLSFSALGVPFLLYQYWIAITHPVLAEWNAQNLTPSPPLWDFLLSFSPALLFAILSLFFLRKVNLNAGMRMLVVWMVIGIVLAYFPFSLQRRFMLGWYIPVTGLAVYGVDAARAVIPRVKQVIFPLVFALAVPTNILILLIALFGILSRAPEYYLTKDEMSVFRWLSENTPVNGIILASPELSQWIPGWTGRKVIYGHPFETVNATEEEAWVRAFYEQNGPVDTRLLEERGIDYLVIGPREREIGISLDVSTLPLVFDAGSVQVRTIQGTP